MTHNPPRRGTLLVGCVVALLAIGGCGGGVSNGPSASPAGIAVGLTYSCGRFPFGVEMIGREPGTAELDANPAAAALRAHLALPGPDIDFLPDHGWILAGIDAQGAEFVTVGGDRGMISAGLDNGPTGWKVTGWGDCQPTVVLPAGLGAASWVFADPQEPDGATRVFDALVTERACASGQTSAGRIVGPQIVAGPEAVLVIFAVRSREGMQLCPSNPATLVTVDLGQDLGERALLDGGQLPFGDPTGGLR